MSAKKRLPPKIQPKSVPVTGDQVQFHDKGRDRERKPGKGAMGVRLQIPKENTYSALEAAQHSDLFPAGQEAFATWVGNRISKHDRLPLSEWDLYLKEFSDRPIHGYRRTQGVDDSHRQ